MVHEIRQFVISAVGKMGDILVLETVLIFVGEYGIMMEKEARAVEYLEVNDNRFEVVCLLGKGKGGYSYLVRCGEKEYVCKQIHHEPCDYYQFGDKLQSELRDYETLSRTGIPMPRLLDVDVQRERILKEYIRGETVLELVKRDALQIYHRQQVEEMCRKLYPAGLNIDYFPTNFVEQDGILYYIDYECNGYMQQWDFENWGCKYWAKTPQLLEYLENH